MSVDALKLTYADIKTVKTRGVYQLVLEGPIEGMQDAMGLLGAPVPGNEVWCAVARLRSGADAPREPEVLPPPRKGTLAQQAGILCNDPVFQKWAYEEYGTYIEDGRLHAADNAAAFVRAECFVQSRADLDGNEAAARKFRDLRADFKLWLSGVEAAA